MPIKTIINDIRWKNFNCSLKINTPSNAENIGIKFINNPALLGPINWTPLIKKTWAKKDGAKAI